MNEVLAKKRTSDGVTQDIYGHTLQVVKHAMSLIEDESIQFISDQIGWTEDKVKDFIFFCTYFHDIGKITEEFQNTINLGEKSYHPFYALFCLDNIDNFTISYGTHGRRGKTKEINLLTTIIATHHTSLQQEKPYSGEDFQFNIIPSFLENELRSFFANYKKYYQKFRSQKCEYHFGLDVKEKGIYDKWKNVIDTTLFKNIRTNDEFEQLRYVFGYVSGLLNLGDWLASSEFENNGNIVKLERGKLPTKLLLESKMKKKRGLKENDEIDRRKFQEEASNIKGNIFMEIPTGEGKTEASLLWAINNLKNEHTKIIYTLPTQTTSNKLYDRISDIFGKEYTGILHGNSDLFLRGIFENENGTVDQRYRSEKTFMKTFCKPITVSTIDAFLKYFINIGRWNIALKNYFNTLLIIDEIHAYDFKLLGFLKKNLELLDFYGIRVCLMSASFPSKLKNKILGNNWESKYKFISQNDLYKKSANTLIKVNKNLSNSTADILKKYNKKKNCIIIRNTVKDAKSIFEELKENNVNCMLYHSSFKRGDRILKEDELFFRLGSRNKKEATKIRQMILNKYKGNHKKIIIKQGNNYLLRDFCDYLNGLNVTNNFILIATQVVEMSLDIDFDIMFTDNAPLDALMQRFGRVNRKKKKENLGEIYIYRDIEFKDGKYPYRNYMLEETYKNLKNGLYELGDYNKRLNTTVDNIFENTTYKNDMIVFEEGEKKYYEKLHQNYGIYKYADDYDLRDIDKQLSKVECYTRRDYENKHLYNKFDESLLIGIPLYILENKRYFNKIKYPKGDLYGEHIYYTVFDCAYDYEYGIDLEKELMENFI